jgi:hypothetical protein
MQENYEFKISLAYRVSPKKEKKREAEQYTQPLRGMTLKQNMRFNKN